MTFNHLSFRAFAAFLELLETDSELDEDAVIQSFGITAVGGKRRRSRSGGRYSIRHPPINAYHDQHARAEQ
ncbi:MAG: hypothetical protein RL701_1470 [Pseudomonadota bacterium]